MNTLHHDNEPMHQTYSMNGADFASDSFVSKYDISNTRGSEMDFYAFDHPSLSDQPGSNDMSAYGMPLSPIMSGNDMFFDDSMGPMHIDPAETWNGSEKTSMSANIAKQSARAVSATSKTSTEHAGHASRLFGQITPPSENDDNTGKPPGERADSGIGQNVSNVIFQSSSKHQPSKARTMSTNSRTSKRARRDSQLSEDEEEGLDGVDGGKREKYREKNRVAAAKCRAKKKTHVDHLEETHRTQSVLNTALKQTEKSLRDELSFWRTQALQHTFCSCRSIQEYNMRKAQNLAAESILGNHISHRSPSLKSVSSASAVSPALEPCGIHPHQSQSVTGFEISTTSPLMAPSSIDKKSNSASGPPGVGAYQSMNRSNSQTSFEAMMQDSTMSSNAEQELKNFVKDEVEDFRS